LRDHPGGLSKKKKTPESAHRSALLQYIEPRIHDGTIVHSITHKLDARTSCARTHEKPVWNPALRVSGDCCDADVAFRSCGETRTTEGCCDRDAFALQIRPKHPRALLQDNAFRRKRQRMGLTAWRGGKYSELVSVVEENNPGRVTSGIQYSIFNAKKEFRARSATNYFRIIKARGSVRRVIVTVWGRDER